MENEIDFVDIVLYGYFHKRKALGNYFYRQFKVAEAKHYGLVEFFSACKEVTLQFQENITKQVRDRRFEIHDVLVAAENGTLGVTIIEGKTKEECIAEAVQYWQEEFELGFGADWAGSVKNYHVHLLSYTYGKHRGMLYWNDTLKIIKGLYDAIQLYKAENAANETNPNTELPQPLNSKADNLSIRLAEYGFFELPVLAGISNDGKMTLIRKMSSKGLPYAVAMFDYLKFNEHLRVNYCKSEGGLHRLIASWFSKDTTGRSVKGNLNSLAPNSTNNTKRRYTAYKNKETVKNDIEQLKKGVLPS
jgi:hypothetical protein